MNWTAQRLKEMARIALKGSYWKCVLVGFLFSLAGGSTVSTSFNTASSYLKQHSSSDEETNFFMAIIAMIGVLIVTIVVLALKIFVLNPLQVGCADFFNRDLYNPVDTNNLMMGFTVNYKNVVKTLFMKDLSIFLWSLLFVIPGIIKAYEYLMVPYILSENPNMDAGMVLQESKNLMYGEKMNAFFLELSFIGWILLTAITGGIVGVLWTNPYMYLTRSALYGALRQKQEFSKAGYGRQY